MVKISSYKGHTIFALILSLLFFNNPLMIAMSIIGANFPDFDHRVKKDNVYKMIILGLLIFIILYILKLPYYLGIIITILGFIFYFSNHRGFTHSIFGLLTLTFLISGILISSIDLITPFQSSKTLIIVILILLMSFSLNRKLFIIFLPLFLISLFLFNLENISNLDIILSFALGYLSHIILDSFSSSGIKLFSPFSNRKVYKRFGLLMIFILIILALINLYLNFESLKEFLYFFSNLLIKNLNYFNN